MQFPAAMIREGLEVSAKNVKLFSEERKLEHILKPRLATPNRLRLDLRTMALREYGSPVEGGIPTLVDAPHAGHTELIADYHSGQSLVETLMANGLTHVLRTDWKTATPGMAISRQTTILLAGAGDDITTPEQVLAAEQLISTPAADIRKKTVPGGHIDLFMGSRTLREYWPEIAQWIVEQ